MEIASEVEQSEEQRNEEFRELHKHPAAMVDTSDKSLLLVDTEEEIRSHWARSEHLQREFASVGSLVSYWAALRNGQVRISKRQ